MEENSIGGRRISFPVFLLKIIAGGVGGIVGTLILLLVFLVVGSLTGGEELADYVSPIFVFLLLIMIFVSSTIGNMVSALLLALTEREKYTKKSTTLYQIFIVSVIIFLLMAPVYFISASIDIGITAYAVALHIILSAQVSALILEIISNNRYALVGVYGVTFSIIVSAAILFGLARIIESPTILLFAALPIVWGSVAMIQSMTSMIYGWLARIYDKDFLATDTSYGDDYGKEDTSDEPPEPKIKDTEGADFLKKKK